MINLDDIKDRSAISLLIDYKGKNPYIQKLQKEYKKKGKLLLTENQTKYIANNINKEPIKIDRVIELSDFFAGELQKNEKLSFIPKRILIQYILAETEKTFHIYGKLKKNQEKSKMYWLPKTQVIDDPYFEPINIDVNFDKYVELDTLHRMPYDHQKEAIKFLLTRNGAILALDMGLGKTMCSIIAALESGAEKILVVCPSSIKINWEREINYYCDHTSIISGKKWNPSKFTIINYDILKNFHTISDGRKKKKADDVVIREAKELINHKFDLVIVDEAHFLKNPKSIRGKVMSEVCVKYGIEKVWLLTGTPIANRPMDYFNLLNLIKAPIANNWQFFATRYCAAKKFFKTLKNGQRKQIWLTDGASNLDELSKKTKNIMLRRKKGDVLDMPDKTITPMLYDLSKKGWSEYDRLWDEYIEKREEEGKTCELQKDLVELILLRKFIAMEAIPYTIELSEGVIEQGQKVVIFTNFTDELMEIHEHFGTDSVIHYGGMGQSEKQRSVDQFMNNPKVKVFIGNIKSAGVGITLTAANIVIFNSYDWVTGNNEQAEDRCIFGNQLILTDCGYVKIENINVGDKVFTHKGNFKKVINTHTHLEDKKLRYDINGAGFEQNLSVTEDHEIFIYDKQNKIFEWVEAKNIDIKKHYLTLKRKEFLYIKKFITDDCVDIVDGYIIYPIKNIFISKPKKGEERVYDLSVEGDHSFVVGNYNVHNCHRIGQKNNVTVYYQLFKDTVSIRMWVTLRNKKSIISQIMGEAVPKPVSDEEYKLMSYIKQLEGYDEES